MYSRLLICISAGSHSVVEHQSGLLVLAAMELFTEALGVLVAKAAAVEAALDDPDGGDAGVRDRTTRT